MHRQALIINLHGMEAHNPQARNKKPSQTSLTQATTHLSVLCHQCDDVLVVPQEQAALSHLRRHTAQTHYALVSVEEGMAVWEQGCGCCAGRSAQTQPHEVELKN